jgi:hypothetical protein
VLSKISLKSNNKRRGADVTTREPTSLKNKGTRINSTSNNGIGTYIQLGIIADPDRSSSCAIVLTAKCSMMKMGTGKSEIRYFFPWANSYSQHMFICLEKQIQAVVQTKCNLNLHCTISLKHN